MAILDLLIDGCVQTDPHPGNYMVRADGRLGCIDFGQLKRLSREKRIAYARMLVHLHRGEEGVGWHY